MLAICGSSFGIDFEWWYLSLLAKIVHLEMKKKNMTSVSARDDFDTINATANHCQRFICQNHCTFI